MLSDTACKKDKDIMAEILVMPGKLLFAVFRASPIFHALSDDESAAEQSKILSTGHAIGHIKHPCNFVLHAFWKTPKGLTVSASPVP